MDMQDLRHISDAHDSSTTILDANTVPTPAQPSSNIEGKGKDKDDGKSESKDAMQKSRPIIPAVFGPVPDREYHEGFMREAINMAQLALTSDETPVGCVFVKDGEIIGRGINGTNASLNGTRHAEFVALAEIMATHPQSILHSTDLYVTVEPCIMCASALRQYRIRAVYFGCLNDRFGGCGGVMNCHSDPSIEPPYPVFGGLYREEAIMLLRRFYVQENEKAPEPKPKKNRELKTEILPVHIAPSAGSAALNQQGGAGAKAALSPPASPTKTDEKALGEMAGKD